MFSFRQSLRMLSPTILLLLISAYQIESFQISPSAAQIVKSPVPVSVNHSFDLSTTPSVARSSTELAAKKKNEEEPVREKNGPVELVFLYLTPWRNPNSIFLYMFGALYFLGKYSEAQMAAGNPL